MPRVIYDYIKPELVLLEKFYYEIKILSYYRANRRIDHDIQRLSPKYVIALSNK